MEHFLQTFSCFPFWQYEWRKARPGKRDTVIIIMKNFLTCKQYRFTYTLSVAFYKKWSFHSANIQNCQLFKEWPCILFKDLDSFRFISVASIAFIFFKIFQGNKILSWNRVNFFFFFGYVFSRVLWTAYFLLTMSMGSGNVPSSIFYFHLFICWVIKQSIEIEKS